jgi:hypothetical protein
MRTPDDDHVVAAIVTDCLLIMRKHTSDTRTKMTACYNLTERILRLFSIQGEKEDVLSLIEDLHEGIKECVEEYYK